MLQTSNRYTDFIFYTRENQKKQVCYSKTIMKSIQLKITYSQQQTNTKNYKKIAQENPQIQFPQKE
jgi:hypothetical protein